MWKVEDHMKKVILKTSEYFGVANNNNDGIQHFSAKNLTACILFIKLTESNLDKNFIYKILFDANLITENNYKSRTLEGAPGDERQRLDWLLDLHYKDWPIKSEEDYKNEIYEGVVWPYKKTVEQIALDLEQFGEF